VYLALIVAALGFAVSEGSAYAQTKLPAYGYINTVAGNGPSNILPEGGYNGDNQLATNAKLNSPNGVAVDSSGNIYIADMLNNRVRKVTASTGVITTVAGNGHSGYNGDNILATSAELNNPTGVAVDSSGNIYIADQLNGRIRKVTASTGFISTVAGDGISSLAPQFTPVSDYNGDNQPATSANLNGPTGVLWMDTGTST